MDLSIIKSTKASADQMAFKIVRIVRNCRDYFVQPLDATSYQIKIAIEAIYLKKNNNKMK